MPQKRDDESQTAFAIRCIQDEVREAYEKRLAALKQTALAAVGHVGYANYAHREIAARKAINQSFVNGEFVDPDDME